MNSSKLENYLNLLKIRVRARRRDTLILGVVFWISFTATIILGIIEQLSGRALILVAGMVVVFGFSYLTTWVKLECIRNSIDILDQLQDGKSR